MCTLDNPEQTVCIVPIMISPMLPHHQQDITNVIITITIIPNIVNIVIIDTLENQRFEQCISQSSITLFNWCNYS